MQRCLLGTELVCIIWKDGDLTLIKKFGERQPECGNWLSLQVISVNNALSRRC